MSFIEATIGELEAQGCFLGIQDGNHGEKHPKSSDYVPEGVPFIMASDISSGHVDVASASKLPQSITDKLRIGFCFGGDVLLSHKGSVGYVAIAPDYDPYLMLTPQVTYYRVNPEKISARFLSYAFREPMFQRRLLSTAGQQGTRGYVGIKAQRQLKVRFCSRSIQDRIVEAISPYDDLIENNRRRIALLEEAARMLYREWFVHFRFPGHEHVKITDGLPEGWERRTLVDAADVRLGKMLDANKNRGELRPYLANVNVRWGGFDLTNLREMRFEESELDKYGLVYGDIVMCEGGEPGRCAVWKDQVPGMTIQKALHRIRPRGELEPLYLYYRLSHMGKSGRLEGLFTGSTIKHLPREKLLKAVIDIPPKQLTREFAARVAPLEAQNRTLEAAISRASHARDLLLPRLMSGEIAV